MSEEENEKHARSLRKLRNIVLIPLIWLVVGVLLLDLIFGVMQYDNGRLLVLRHGLAAAMMAPVTILVLLQVRRHANIVVPTAIGVVLLLIAQSVRVVREAHVLDAWMDPYWHKVLTLFENAFNGLGLIVLVAGFLYALIEILAAKYRADAEQRRLENAMDERERAEEERVRLATAIEQASESVIVADTAGAIVYVNPAFERQSGYTRDEVIGKTPRILRSGKHDPEFYRELWQTIAGGKTWRGHFTNRRKDGSLFEEDATISCVRNAAGEIINYVALKHDMTHEISLERQLRQAQRMEAMGTFAGHIAHDFNNILTLVLGHAEIATRALPQDHPVMFNIRHIAKAGNRARDLVKQILTFSRRIEAERRPLQIGGVVQEAVEFLRVSLPATVELRTQIREHCGFVMADPTHIHQILMNLCANAMHAMQGTKGELLIALDVVHLPEGFVADAGAPAAGDYVRLLVRDVGHGMDAKTMQHMFDPFFTTKKQGEGTGLGLSTVHGIVLSYGGGISVSSEVGSGSTFQVYLPRIESGAQEAPEVDACVVHGNERVLLVDDAAEIVEMHKLDLEALGYSVTGFSSSKEALDAFRERPGDFDLVITDQVMPNMTGLDMAHEMLAINPHLPVILMTGFGQGITAAQAKLAGISEFLTKPISSVNLCRAMRRCLDRDSAASA